jgi:hypothetical protein
VLLIYTPASGERQELSFKPAELWSPEAEAIEDVGGDAWDTFQQFGEKFIKGNRRAYRAALWIMLKRQDPKLKFAALTVRMDELTVDFDPDERTRIRAAVEDSDDISDDDRRLVLDTLNDDESGKGEPGGDSTDSP